MILKQFDKLLKNSKLSIRIIKGDINKGVDLVGDMRPFIIFKCKED